MNQSIIKILHNIDLYDYLKIIKEKFFKNQIEKDLELKRYNFYSKLINKNDICFDIGANYGNRVEIFLKLGAKVIAVEPQPIAIKFLKRKYGEKITIVEKAIGSIRDKSTMYISYDSPLSSLSSEWISEVSKKRFKHVVWDKKIEVDIITFDNLIEKYGKPDFCKIDVEGYELEVIKGLTKPIKIISFEYTIPEFTEKAIECIKYLEGFGNIVCNYSAGETLQFGLEEWQLPSDFIDLFRILPDKGIIDGDIYVKYLDK